MEQKINKGDWVIGWHCNHETFREKRWKVHEVFKDGGDWYVRPRPGSCTCTGLGDVRLVLSHEIPDSVNNNYNIF